MLLNLSNKKVIIISHILTTVPAADLEKYFLQQNVQELLFIGHPLFFLKGRPGSHYRYYRNGSLIANKQLIALPLPGLVQYAWDMILSVWWIFIRFQRWDLIIALDNLNALAALFLRSIFFTKKVVYYTIDFVPQRFSMKIVNDLYHYIDKVCVRFADATWNVSERIAEGREKIRGLKRSIYNRQQTVPIGIWIRKKKSSSKHNPHVLVYAGGLLPHQGIHTVIQAIPLIIKQIPDFKFIIIGIGEYESYLQSLSVKLRVDDYIEFKGYFESHEDVEKILNTCGVAVAMYSKSLDKWSYYADPSKIKTYLAAGLPVITTRLTHIARQLEKDTCGIIVDESPQSIARAVIQIMKNKSRLSKMRASAIAFVKQYDWNIVFFTALYKLYANNN